MSEINIALAEESIECGNERYVLTPPNYNTHRAYSTYLEQTALEAIIRNKKALGREYQETRNAWATACARGDFEWGSKTWLESLNVDDRIKELCYLVLLQKHPDLKRQKFEEIWKTPDKFVSEETNELEDGIKGHNIWRKILNFLQRPN